VKTKPAYLVIRAGKRQPRIHRVTQSWPALEPGDAIVRVSLELPDDFLLNPEQVLVIPAAALAVVATLEEPIKPPEEEE
jgi:hypothetical protein